MANGAIGIRVPDNIFELLCELCGGGHHENQIILCDRCDRGCHLFCLMPPLDAVPEGEWVCPLCRAADAASSAFKEGQEYTLLDFERIANTFKVNTFGSEAAARKVWGHAQVLGPFCGNTSHCILFRVFCVPERCVVGCCVYSKVRMHFPGVLGQPEACCEGCLSVPGVCGCLSWIAKCCCGRRA